MADPRNGAGVYGSAGTRDTRVDRPDEGLPGLATVENPTANPPTRASFDIARANGFEVMGQGASGRVVGTIDTTWTGGTRPDQEVAKRT